MGYGLRRKRPCPFGWRTSACVNCPRIAQTGLSSASTYGWSWTIARALLKQAPIVLLDEATSALDAENEANIVKSIEELRKSSTVIAVAHKLETIKMADKIIVLNASGSIKEEGTHDELLALNGAYADFWGKRVLSAQWKLA